MSTGPADVIERIVEQGGDADDILRAAVAALADEPRVSWAGIAFVEGATLRLGPTAGLADEARRLSARIVYQGADVGELWVDGDVEPRALEHVVALLAPYALIGWDTGGETWDP